MAAPPLTRETTDGARPRPVAAALAVRAGGCSGARRDVRPGADLPRHVAHRRPRLRSGRRDGTARSDGVPGRRGGAGGGGDRGEWADRLPRSEHHERHAHTGARPRGLRSDSRLDRLLGLPCRWRPAVRRDAGRGDEHVRRLHWRPVRGHRTGAAGGRAATGRRPHHAHDRLAGGPHGRACRPMPGAGGGRFTSIAATSSAWIAGRGRRTQRRRAGRVRARRDLTDPTDTINASHRPDRDRLDGDIGSGDHDAGDGAKRSTRPIRRPRQGSPPLPRRTRFQARKVCRQPTRTLSQKPHPRRPPPRCRCRRRA